MITRERAYLQNGPGGKLLQGCLSEHLRGTEKLNALHDMYAGSAPILSRERAEGLPNHRLCHGFARYIVTLASAYLAGGAVSYTMEDGSENEALRALLAAYRAADAASVDIELSKQASLYGRGVEILWADEKTRPRTAALAE